MDNIFIEKNMCYHFSWIHLNLLELFGKVKIFHRFTASWIVLEKEPGSDSWIWFGFFQRTHSLFLFIIAESSLLQSEKINAIITFVSMCVKTIRLDFITLVWNKKWQRGLKWMFLSWKLFCHLTAWPFLIIDAKNEFLEKKN